MEASPRKEIMLDYWWGNGTQEHVLKNIFFSYVNSDTVGIWNWIMPCAW